MNKRRRFWCLPCFVGLSDKLVATMSKTSFESGTVSIGHLLRAPKFESLILKFKVELNRSNVDAHSILISIARVESRTLLRPPTLTTLLY
jgi:hypothetical protein